MGVVSGPRGVAVVLFAGMVISAACKPKPELDFERIKSIGPTPGGKRQLAELDAVPDGRIDAEDTRAFDILAQRSTAVLASRGLSIGIDAGLYDGPEKDAPSVFSLVTQEGSKLELSTLPKERLIELAVESRWMGRQANVATLFEPAALDGRVFGGSLATSLPGYQSSKMEPAAVCKAIETFDVTPFQKIGVQPAAVFDLDSTVWDGNVSDTFLAVLAERKVPKEEANTWLRPFLKEKAKADPAVVDANDVAQNTALLLHHATDPGVPEDQRVSLADSFYKTVQLLEGIPEAEVTALAEAAFKEGAGKFGPQQDKIYASKDGCSMRRIISLLTERGIAVYIVTATIDELGYAAGRILGVPREQIIASIVERKDGKLTGVVTESTYYTKAPIVRQWLPAPPAFAFGDSATSDFAMMEEAYVAAFMVNARDQLQARDDSEAGSRMVALRFEATEGALEPKP